MPNEKKSILQPKNDVVFKALFSRGKPRITQAMLEAILKMKIDKLELDKSTDLLNENADDKNGRLDLRAIINGNTECDIEVQLTSNDNIAERFVYYWAKMYAANLKIGDTYSDLRKTISIIILDDDFKLTKNLGKPQTTWKIRESENTHLILTDYFEIIIIEIPKVLKAYHKNPNDEVLQWMLFLDNPEKEEVTRIMEENKDIKEAKEELDRISQDDILRRKALNRTLEIADRLQLKKEAEEALEKGKKEKTNEIVKRMKDADLSIEQIAQIVELKVDEVKAILNEKN
ncbi:MAG: Rpn family recombination-promoting nuclease/putative transposase [Clostridia bacterium]|jgi:predicted transposase/invertase (TIGR01784 family)